MVCIVLSVLALGYLAARVSAAICRSDVEPCTHLVRVNPRGLVGGCKCFKTCRAAQEAIGLQNAVASGSVFAGIVLRYDVLKRRSKGLPHIDD